MYNPQKWEDVKPLFKIKFTTLGLLPVSLEDFFFCDVNNNLVFSCGYTGDYIREKGIKYLPNKVTRRFINDTYLLSIDKLKKNKLKFKKGPCFPAELRQKGGSISIHNKLYCWGGFRYDPSSNNDPKTLASKKKDTKAFKDGYMFYYDDKKKIYKWSKLPDLPYELCAFSLTEINNIIYLFGGSEYNDSSFNTWNTGNKLYCIDINNLDKGWIPLTGCLSCVPRYNHVSVNSHSKLLILGGTVGRIFGGQCYSTIDNWIYDPAYDKWERIIDCPTIQTHWQYCCTYQNRYVLLVGGTLSSGRVDFENFLRTGMNINKKQIEPYGVLRQNIHNKINIDGSKILKFNPKKKYARSKQLRILNTFKKSYRLSMAMSAEILIFDMKDNKFYRVDGIKGGPPLPVNSNNAAIYIIDNKLYVFGGETDLSMFENYVYRPSSTDIILAGELIPVTSDYIKI